MFFELDKTVAQLLLTASQFPNNRLLSKLTVLIVLAPINYLHLLVFSDDILNTLMHVPDDLQ